MFRLYVKTTMRMLTILREAEEWTRVHLREACLLFASAITKMLSLRTSKRQSACTSNNFTFARPLMGTIFLVFLVGYTLTRAVYQRGCYNWGEDLTGLK